MKKITLAIISLLAALSSLATDFDTRASEYLGYYGTHGKEKWLYGVFRQLARNGAGLPYEQENIDDIFATIKSNRDCNDFTLNGLLRMVYLDRAKPSMTASMKDRAKERILDFKYWWDDPRPDSTYRCYHTENHQALYHTAELLAGQLYKDMRFSSGLTGREHMEHARERLLPWLDHRFRFGFSEWLSTYYEVEALLLLNLHDFAEDPEIRRRATNVLDLLMFDMALNQRNGYMCGSSGRVYATSLITGTHVTSPLIKLAFGLGTYDREEATGAVALATSSYRCPEVIVAIANDSTVSYDNLQRMSLNVEDAGLYGIDRTRELDCHLFWGMQEFIHPLAIHMSKSISQKYGTWPYGDYDRYIAIYEREAAEGKTPSDRDRFALSEASVITRRTPHYSLSTALDYRAGKPGYQQHPWMATLGTSTTVYTNCPGGDNLRQSPNYWAGNEYLPRAAQHGNVAICIHDIPEGTPRRFSHAHFPAAEMDETVRSGHWTFGRKGDGYIAIYSSTEPVLLKDFRNIECDLKADSPFNIWVCELGDAAHWQSFEAFRKAVLSADISVHDRTLRYASPSSGTISFGLSTPLTADGREISLRLPYRYNNPYCTAPVAPDSITISRGPLSHTLTR